MSAFYETASCLLVPLIQSNGRKDRRSKTGIDLISIYTVYSLTKTLYSLIFSCTVDLFMYINLFLFVLCVELLFYTYIDVCVRALMKITITIFI